MLGDIFLTVVANDEQLHKLFKNRKNTKIENFIFFSLNSVRPGASLPHYDIAIASHNIARLFIFKAGCVRGKGCNDDSFFLTVAPSHPLSDDAIDSTNSPTGRQLLWGFGGV